MDWLIKVSLMNVFPYLVPAFGKIAASKEYSVTPVIRGGNAKEMQTFLTDCEVTLGTIKPLEEKMLFQCVFLPCKICHKHSP